MEFSGFHEDRAAFRGMRPAGTDRRPRTDPENTPHDAAKQRSFPVETEPGESLPASASRSLSALARAAGYRLVEPSGSGGYGPLVQALRTALEAASRAEARGRGADGTARMTAGEARRILAALEDVLSKAAATCETLGSQV